MILNETTLNTMKFMKGKLTWRTTAFVIALYMIMNGFQVFR